jgi:fibronectin type 3 domain-containing protein
LTEGLANVLNFIARDSLGNSVSQTITIVYDADPPAALSADVLEASGAGDGSEVFLSWSTYIVPEDLAYYRVYVSGADFNNVDSLIPIGNAEWGGKSFIVSDLTGGQTYYFAVVPVDAAGNSISDVVTASAAPIDAAPPEDVTGFEALSSYSVADGNHIVLYWSASANMRGDLAAQLLYIDAGNGYGDGIELDKTLTQYTVATYADAPLTDATVYRFKIETRDENGLRSDGVIADAVTRLPNPAVELVSGKNQIAINWTPVDSNYVDSYQLYRAQSELQVSDLEQVQLVKNGSVLSYVDTGLTNGSTYWYAVTSVSSSGAENREAAFISAQPRQDADGPVISGPFLVEQGKADIGITDNFVFTRSSTIKATASDVESTVIQIDICLDNIQPCATTKDSFLYWDWDLLATTDGNHQLKVLARDSSGNVSELVRNVVVNLVRPNTPDIESHVVDANSPTLLTGISGTAEEGTLVILKVNGVVRGAPAVVTDGAFSFNNIILIEGDNNLSAMASHRGGDSPYSSPYPVSVDTGAPPAPVDLVVESLAGGTVQLVWQNGIGEIPVAYNIYSSQQPFESIANTGVSKLTNEPILYRFQELLPQSDAPHYYAVTALDSAGNESAVSNSFFATSDRTVPEAVVTFSSDGQTLETGTVVGPGIVQVSCEVSEELIEAPFLSLEPTIGSPVVIDLSQVDATHYLGSITVDVSAPHGSTVWKFSGKDLIGNRGYSQAEGLILDVRGPVATVVSPNGLLQSVGNATVTLAFNEAPVGVPEVVFVDAAAASVPVTGLVKGADPLQWSGALVLDGIAEGNGQFVLNFAYDSFGNLGNKITGTKTLQIYRDLPPKPDTPVNLTATPLEAGEIELNWLGVNGATAYEIQRRLDDSADFSVVATVTDISFVDLPDADGDYKYTVIAIGQIDTSRSDQCDTALAASDRTAPATPDNLQLELIGNGIKATWAAPAGALPETYKLYRAADITGTRLTEVAESTTEEAIDIAPVTRERYYAVSALDVVGNESPLSALVVIDFPVAPVQNLTLQRVEERAPTITWTAGEEGQIGFYLYRNGQQINSAATPSRTFTDGLYGGGSVTYGIAAVSIVDGQEKLSPIREISLPQLTMSIPDGTVLRRGLLEKMSLKLQSTDDVVVQTLRLQVGSNAATVYSNPVNLSAGTTTMVEKVVATAANASTSVPVLITAELEPSPGSRVVLTQTSTIDVIGSGTAMEIYNQPLVRGTQAEVRLKINNLGSARMEFLTSENGGATDDVTIYLRDQDGNLLAQGQLDQQTGSQVINSSGYARAQIDPGQSFLTDPITFNVPATVSSAVVIEAIIGSTYYHYGQADVVVAPGLRQSVDAGISAAPYSANAMVDKTIYVQGEEVLVSGLALDNATGEFAPNVPVRIGISLKGFDRFVEVKTDANGNYLYHFQPSSGESGTYSVWAMHPEQTDRAVQATFDIVGLQVVPRTVNLTLGRGKFFDVPITLRNLGEIAQTGLSLTPTASAGFGIQVLEDLTELAAGESKRINVRLSADDAASESGYAAVDVASATGTSGRVDFNIETFDPADPLPLIKTDISYIDTGMLRSTQKVETFTLSNVGYGPLINAHLDGPSLPWLSLITNREIGDLGVGESVPVGVFMTPAETLEPGVYDDRIIIYSDNHIPYTFNIQVTIASEAVGSVYFDIQNELYDKLEGASIVLQHQKLFDLMYSVNACGNDKSNCLPGSFLLNDIPEGSYSFNVSAADHYSYSGTFDVDSGKTKVVSVALEIKNVDIEWSVVPTEIEDRYEIQVKQTFVTNVPTPVLVSEPAITNLPAMEPGDVFNGEYTIKNYGLIAVDNLRIDFSKTFGEYDLDVLSDTIPSTIGPNQSVKILFLVTKRFPETASTALYFEQLGGFGGGGTEGGVIAVSGDATICPDSDSERIVTKTSNHYLVPKLGESAEFSSGQFSLDTSIGNYINSGNEKTEQSGGDTAGGTPGRTTYGDTGGGSCSFANAGSGETGLGEPDPSSEPENACTKPWGEVPNALSYSSYSNLVTFFGDFIEFTYGSDNPEKLENAFIVAANVEYPFIMNRTDVARYPVEWQVDMLAGGSCTDCVQLDIPCGVNGQKYKFTKPGIYYPEVTYRFKDNPSKTIKFKYKFYVFDFRLSKPDGTLIPETNNEFFSNNGDFVSFSQVPLTFKYKILPSDANIPEELYDVRIEVTKSAITTGHSLLGTPIVKKPPSKEKFFDHTTNSISFFAARDATGKIGSGSEKVATPSAYKVIFSIKDVNGNSTDVKTYKIEQGFKNVIREEYNLIVANKALIPTILDFDGTLNAKIHAVAGPTPYEAKYVPKATKLNKFAEVLNGMNFIASSTYRNPYKNMEAGSNTMGSRHVWSGALDVYSSISRPALKTMWNSLIPKPVIGKMLVEGSGSVIKKFLDKRVNDLVGDDFVPGSVLFPKSGGVYYIVWDNTKDPKWRKISYSYKLYTGEEVNKCDETGCKVEKLTENATGEYDCNGDDWDDISRNLHIQDKNSEVMGFE